MATPNTAALDAFVATLQGERQARESDAFAHMHENDPRPHDDMA